MDGTIDIADWETHAYWQLPTQHQFGRQGRTERGILTRPT
jgi:hypothetical protein